ncbi:YqaA family protein [Novosphingobium album (ex Hu et al. 2023)]|uniref:VTT domain-containing protein n=1 Tax=Novosphingobium album (ex Hu et al. 2023) TaxID=2930093 RepID=A0ABT0B0V2_9SPHN|nr:VTT domain-containing protein [Novosphingobium album (ex Hu et al. 2023)]MCJ2178669.1 VTT domain-containing protein [Novosphingobium album (ex Hu et al. 2023)]
MLRRLYDWTMEKAAHRHAAWWLAAFAFMEASFFPVPPHPLLGLMCLAEPKKAIRFAVVATLASVAGGLLGYAIGHLAFEAFGEAMLRALGLADSFPKAACYLREYGAEIIVVKGATPIPFKLLTITAGFIGMNLLVFIGASIVSRSISFMIVGVLFRLFGAPIKAFIDKYLGLVTVGFVALIILGFLAVAFTGGGSQQTSEKCASATMATLH